MFTQPYPFDNGKGILTPVINELIVRNVYFDEVATAKDVIAFDVEMVAASTWETNGFSSGVSTSAWGRVRDPDVSTSTVPRPAMYVYGVANADTAAAARGDVTVIGKVTGLVKVASANHTLGQPFLPSQASVNKVAVCNQLPATSLVATGEIRPIIAIAASAGTSTTALTAFFNGFGHGRCGFLTNVAYAADS